MFPTLDRLFTRTKRARFFGRPDVIQLLICSLIIVLSLLLLSTNLFSRVENIFLDAFIRSRTIEKAEQSPVVIIDIDEESLRAIGNWPWPWRYHGEMIKILKQWGARAVLVDHFFREFERDEDDNTLQDEMKKADQVYLPVILESKRRKKYWVHSMPVVVDPESNEKEWIRSVKDVEVEAAGVGHVNTLPDSDGILRRIPNYLSAGGETFHYLGTKIAEKHSDLAKTGKENVPLDERQNMLIDWRGGWGEIFTRISFAEIVRSYQAMMRGRTPKITPEQIKGKICLVGLTPSDYAFTFSTPYGADYPLIGVHATMIDNFLNRKYITPTPFIVNALCMVFLGFLVSAIFVSYRNSISFVVALGVGIAWVLLAYTLFMTQGIWLLIFQPLLLILVLFIFSTIFGYVVTTQEQARLFNLATRDGLTGLYVIRYFRELINQEVEEFKHTKEPLAVVLTDIDNFKPINDTYGHQAGDLILKKAAEAVKSRVRINRPFGETDFVARYGGEEFIVMLRNVDYPKGAQKVAERIRKAVESLSVEWEGTKIPVTISLGVGLLHEGENVPDAMIRRADEALYVAKRTGKNKVCMEGEKESS